MDHFPAKGLHRGLAREDDVLPGAELLAHVWLIKEQSAQVLRAVANEHADHRAAGFAGAEVGFLDDAADGG